MMHQMLLAVMVSLRKVLLFCKLRLDQLTKIMCLTLLFLLGLSCLPALEIKAIFPSTVVLRKMDLFSDIRYSGTMQNNSMALEEVIDSITDNSASTTKDPIIKDLGEDELVSVKVKEDYDNFCKNLTKDPVYFEDYTRSDALEKLAVNFLKAQNGKRSVRIAFLGDSFIESDILTADIRALLQSFYGGNGVGFVPMASVASKFRRTVTHNFSGWKSYSMVQYKQANWRKLTLSGYYYEPENGATIKLDLSNGKERFKPVSKAKLLFLNEGAAQINAQINGGKEHVHTPASGKSLQSLDFSGSISSVSMNFKNTEGFTAYGVYLNDPTGIYVDNYSVRGSSGIVLSVADRALCRSLDSIMHYDLIVLQYGLNVASAMITNYSYYQKKMVEVVKQLKEYFPRSTFLIMGVGDRSMKSSSGFETMPGIIAMVDVQRNVARQSQCIFWDTYAAMGGKNSMSTFVQHTPPLASKDYTHINHAGGRCIARSFVYALMKDIESKLSKYGAGAATKTKANAKE